MRAPRTPLALVIGVVAGSLLSSTSALAFWSNNSTGSGEGSATVAAGNSRPITIIQTSALTPLSPGQSVALAGTFNNPNDGYANGAVTVRTVTVSIVGVHGSPQCSVTNFTLSHATMPVNATIPHGERVGHWSGAVVTMVNSNRDQGACHGAQVLLHYSSN
jgi:hypothetical protein